jgi:primosomal protein N' (replication factor Y)
MSKSKQKYVEVLLPLALPKTYTYSVPEKFNNFIQFGIRVEVSLKNKFYSGLIISIHEEIQKQGYSVKDIISVIDQQPIIEEKHYELWKWISEYYMCTTGEVMNAALPTGLKMSSETMIELLPETDLIDVELSDEEYLIYEALRIKGSVTLREIKEILGRSTVFNVIRTLSEKELVILKEELINSYKPKKIKLISLSDGLNDEDSMYELLEKFKRSKHKTNALIAYYQLSNNCNEVLKSELMALAGVSSSVIKDLVDNEIFNESDKRVSRLKNWRKELTELPQLSETQKICVGEIDELFKNGNHLLLHGITGSGKTRIYQEFISRTIKNGGQVLYLVPEIGLTTQMINRLTSILGDEVYIFHSKLNQQERVEIWNAVHQGKSVILAARSGIFLPFRNLQLIIVDEEHDSSYKQQSPSPHYNARDIASFLGTKLNIKVILGSATPSLESYYNCMINKYSYVKIDQRFGEVSLPEIRIIDMKMKSALLPDNSKYSIALVSMIQQAINNEEQVLLFQNRRGFAPTILCNTCGWNAKCPNCDVSLTYHKNMGELKCHYCGFRKNSVEICPACGSVKIGHLGFGTEKIEHELANIFPDARVKRMDLDTIRTKSDVETIMNEFEEKKIDILVGTQMITKGLDFEKIGLVGIIDIDRLMQFPDFRANERAFQLAVQVGGRAGRRKKQGLVIIQTYDPDNQLLKDILNSDYENFAVREFQERELYQYPPFTRIIEITIMHKKYEVCREGANTLAHCLKSGFKSVLGPAVPGIGRIRGLFLFSIILKIDKSGTDPNSVRKKIFECKNKVMNIDGFRSLKINIDVDPY